MKRVSTLVLILLVVLFTVNAQIFFNSLTVDNSPKLSYDFAAKQLDTLSVDDTKKLYMISFESEVIGDAGYTLRDKIVTYLPEDSFLLYVSDSEAERYSRLSGVKFIDLLPNVVKVGERLRYQLDYFGPSSSPLVAALSQTFANEVKGVFENLNMSSNSSSGVENNNERGILNITAEIDNSGVGLVSDDYARLHGDIDSDTPAHKMLILSAIDLLPLERASYETIPSFSTDNTINSLKSDSIPSNPTTITYDETELDALYLKMNDLIGDLASKQYNTILQSLSKTSSKVNGKIQTLSGGVGVSNINIGQILHNIDLANRKSNTFTTTNINTNFNSNANTNTNINTNTKSSMSVLFPLKTAILPADKSLIGIGKNKEVHKEINMNVQHQPKDNMDTQDDTQHEDNVNINTYEASIDTVVSSFIYQTPLLHNNMEITSKAVVLAAYKALSSSMSPNVNNPKVQNILNNNDENDKNGKNGKNIGVADKLFNNDSEGESESESDSVSALQSYLDHLAVEILSNLKESERVNDNGMSTMSTNTNTNTNANTDTNTNTNTNFSSLSLEDQTLSLSHILSSILDEQHHHLTQFLTNTITSLSSLSSTLMLDLKPRFISHNKYSRLSAVTGDDSTLTPNSNDNTQIITPFHARDIYGLRVSVGIADSGLDPKSCFFYSKNDVAYDAVSDLHRKILTYIRYADDRDSWNGHGTHVAGTIAGNAFRSDGLTALKNKQSMYNGIAPGAMVSMFDIGDDGAAGTERLILPDDVSTLFKKAADAGARTIYSNSWGCGGTSYQPKHLCAVYDLSSFLIDKYTQASTSSLVVFSAGNDGNQYTSVTTPATAKNSLVVGATYSHYNGFLESEVKNIVLPTPASDTVMFSTDTIAYFSSMGPTRDMRVKPDISTVGAITLSAKSQGGSTTGGNNIYTCELSPKIGTSMAAPAVSGTAALLEQYLKSKEFRALEEEQPYVKYPLSNISGSLMKAILLNGGQDVKYKQVELGTDQSVSPLLRQTDSNMLPPSDGDYKPIYMGQVYTFPTGKHNYVFKLSPLRTEKKDSISLDSITSNARGVRVIYRSSNGCDNDGVVAVVYRESGNPQRTMFYHTNYFDLSLDANENEGVYKITMEGRGPASCEYLFSVVEFNSNSVENAPTYTLVNCETTARDLPYLSRHPGTGFTNNFNHFYSNYHVACPPTPLCSNLNTNTSEEDSKQQVKGLGVYSLDTPICKAALHAAAVDPSLTQTKLSVSEIEQLKKEGTRQLVLVNAYKYVTGIGYGKHVVAPSHSGAKFNSISSGSLNLATGDMFFIPTTLGSTTTPLSPSELAKEKAKFRSQYLPLIPLTEGPNNLSGFGKLQLTSTAFLPDTLINRDTNGIISNSVGNKGRKKLLVLNSGTEYLTHKSYATKCFTISTSTYYGNLQGLESQSNKRDGMLYSTGLDELKVTLSWADHPTNPSTADVRGLINDLDLFVFGGYGGVYEYRGNNRVDKRNPVEQVVLRDNIKFGGMYCATVYGSYVPLLEQKYALVATGRGLEHCEPKPDQPLTNRPLTGIWKRDIVNGSGHNDDKDECSNLDPLIDIIQGGVCVMLRNHAVKSYNNGFHGLRISPQDPEDWKATETLPATSSLSYKYPHKNDNDSDDNDGESDDDNDKQHSIFGRLLTTNNGCENGQVGGVLESSNNEDKYQFCLGTLFNSFTLKHVEKGCEVKYSYDSSNSLNSLSLPSTSKTKPNTNTDEKPIIGSNRVDVMTTVMNPPVSLIDVPTYNSGFIVNPIFALFLSLFTICLYMGVF